MKLLYIFVLLLILGEFRTCAFFFVLEEWLRYFCKNTAQVLNVLHLSDRAVDGRAYVYRPGCIGFALLLLLLIFLSIVIFTTYLQQNRKSVRRCRQGC